MKPPPPLPTSSNAAASASPRMDAPCAPASPESDPSLSVRHLGMKKKTTTRDLTLGDLILAVGSSTRSNRETLAAVADLLESGRVRLQSGRRTIRARAQ